MAALSTVILYLGALIDVLDISMAVLASVFVAIMVIEYGGILPWTVFGTTSLLSLILLPYKLPAFIYLVFFGYYPIIKAYVERIRRKIMRWAVKLCIFIAGSSLLFLLSKIFITDIVVPEGIIAKIFAVMVILVFIFIIFLYDLALTRVITFYIVRLRHRFRKIF